MANTQENEELHRLGLTEYTTSQRLTVINDRRWTSREESDDEQKAAYLETVIKSCRENTKSIKRNKSNNLASRHARFGVKLSARKKKVSGL